MVVLEVGVRGRFMKNFRFDSIYNITPRTTRTKEVQLCTLRGHGQVCCDKRNHQLLSKVIV